MLSNLYLEINLQNEKLAKWHYIYNYLRPHQVLGNLLSIGYYEKIRDQFSNLSQKLSNQQPYYYSKSVTECYEQGHIIS